MKVLIGLLFVTAGFYIALDHLSQNIRDFYDVVAFAMVIFGSIAALVMTMPSLKLRYIVMIFLRGIFMGGSDREKAIRSSLNFLKDGILPKGSRKISDRIIRDGDELILLGIKHETVKEILSARIEKYTEDITYIGQWIRGLSKYPPAFGLAGTVLGLIHLMNGLSEGADPQETGIRMAIALLATFYGIIVANVFVNPVGDRIVSSAAEERVLAEISLNAILLKLDDNNLVEAVEFFNNYLPGQSKKIDFDYTTSSAA